MAKNMILKETLGIPAEEITGRQHNLWVGVSDSTWFNAPGNLEALVRWSLAHTRDHLLIWIPGRLYAVNFNHIEKESRAKALREGYAAEDRFRKQVARILEDDPGSWARIRMANYDEMMTTVFIRRRLILFRAFSEEGILYERLMEIARDFLHSRGRTVTDARTEAVALYQLQELPMFLGPVSMIGDETEYAVEIYPGLGKLDLLVRDLIEGRLSQTLSSKLWTIKRCGVASVLPEETPCPSGG